MWLFKKKIDNSCLRCKCENTQIFEVHNTMILKSYNKLMNDVRRDDSSFLKNSVGVCNRCGAHNWKYECYDYDGRVTIYKYGTKTEFEDFLKQHLINHVDLNKNDTPIIKLTYKAIL